MSARAACAAPPAQPVSVRLRSAAAAVRRLGNAFRADPEELVAERQRLEAELLAIAREVETMAAV